MTEQIADGIWTFRVRLPDNPLKWLNTYVIKGNGGRSLLIDTGFHRRECQEDLFLGMEELKLDPAETDVFLTHLHSDHTGNAAELAALGCRIIMGGIDHDMFHGRDFNRESARPVLEGMPREFVAEIPRNNPARVFRSAQFDARSVADGEVLSYGGRELRCVHTPGHTPGHICLYDEANALMFLGDHILFDITPNITYWPGYEDSLGMYLDSLRAIKRFRVETALPAHRTAGSVTMTERAEELICHHARRLAETERIIAEEPGLTAYDIAGRMTWQIRARSWSDFPPAQKWFAFGETVAHLDYLRLRGAIAVRTGADGVRTYFPD